MKSYLRYAFYSRCFEFLPVQQSCCIETTHSLCHFPTWVVKAAVLIVVTVLLEFHISYKDRKSNFSLFHSHQSIGVNHNLYLSTFKHKKLAFQQHLKHQLSVRDVACFISFIFLFNFSLGDLSQTERLSFLDMRRRFFLFF